MQQKDVLLMICPAWGVAMPPLGIAYIAADLEQKNIPCDILDLNILLYQSADAKTRQLWRMENYHLWAREDLFQDIVRKFAKEIELWADNIVARGVRIVGLSMSGANILFSIEMARMLRRKRKDICIVFGGPACSFLHDNARMPFRFFVSMVNGEPLLDNGVADYIVMGDGEGVFADIVLAYRSGRLLKRVGVAAASFPVTEPIQKPWCIDDLDKIPFPAWDKFPLEKYGSRKEVPILFSRGCINRCVFCNDWRIRNGSFQYRSAANIFEEMRMVQKKFQKSTFQCHDLLFNGNLPVLDELADLILNANLKINWAAQGVVRTDMDLGLLRKLRKAGLNTIVYGVESLSDNVLKKMGKRFTYEDIRIVLERTKQAGIRTCINLIVGFPAETEEEFSVTQKRVRELQKVLYAVTSLNPCRITASTDLEYYPQKFSIRASSGEGMCERWESVDGGNNFETRQKRIRELFELLRSLKIKTLFTGNYEEERRSFKAISGYRLRRLPLLLLLLASHWGLLIYMFLVKKIRKCVISLGG